MLGCFRHSWDSTIDSDLSEKSIKMTNILSGRLKKHIVKILVGLGIIYCVVFFCFCFFHKSYNTQILK